jgi:hypothetical protein
LLPVDEDMELVVTVKASPAVSRTLDEVVCVAGVRTDVEPHRWVRLYPIAFRRPLPSSRCPGRCSASPTSGPTIMGAT